MSTLIFCHNLEEFNLFYRELNSSKDFFKKNYFILKNKKDTLKITKLFSKDSFFFQEHDSKVPEFSGYILNAEIISKFKNTELLFFQTMDYYEYENYAITSKDSRQTFYYYLNNILQFIKINNFKSIYFSHNPHSLVEILFLSIFKELRLKTVFVRGLPIADMYTYQKDIFQHKKFQIKTNSTKAEKAHIHPAIKKFITHSKSNFNFASTKANKWTNYYLVQLYYKFPKFRFIIFYSSIFFLFFKYFFRMSIILNKLFFFYIYDLFSKNNKFRSYFYSTATLKKKNQSLQYSRVNKLDLEKILLRGYIQKNQNLNHYYSLIENNLELKDKYIFFPLWFQPSSTTYPFAGRMVDYEISINMLSAALPSNYKILIKESPDIFNLAKHSWFKGNFVRNKSFYSEISKNKKIKLVDFSYKDSELIDASVAVVSLCDKFNLIALIRGKPSITFVDTVTTELKNSFYCKNINDIKNAVRKINEDNNDFNKQTNKDLNNFFDILSKNSFYNPFNVGFNNLSTFYNYKQAARLFKKII
jgi:hypothetical protein